MITRDDALALDAADPLRAFRDRFHIPDPSVIYLDGNSLGMPPRRTLERLTEVFHDDWATGLIRSWDHWLDMPQRVGDVLAPLILSLIHISEPTRLLSISYAVFCLKKKKKQQEHIRRTSSNAPTL